MPKTSTQQQKIWRNYIATLKFLTIFPAPKVNARISPKLSMFPLVGLSLGLLLYLSGLLGSGLYPLATAFVLLLIWTGSTGFLHLDGLGDLADGLGAAHQDKAKLLQVMQSPDIGTFAVVAMVLLLLGKFALLGSLVFVKSFAPLLLIPAWARLGAAWWASSLTPLHEGLASWCRQADHINLMPWFALLLLLSLIFAPILLLAPLLLWVWKAFLERKLGGMNGDALGAGIEITELGMLLLCCFTV